MGFNEQAKQGLMIEMGMKTKCGLRRAHFRQNRFWRQEREREEIGLRRNQGFGGRSSPFLVAK